LLNDPSCKSYFDLEAFSKHIENMTNDLYTACVALTKFEKAKVSLGNIDHYHTYNDETSSELLQVKSMASNYKNIILNIANKFSKK